MLLPVSPRPIVAEEYRRPVLFALKVQVPICVICLLMLDGGRLARTCGCAMSACWLGVALIWLRRPFSPTKSDSWFIRFGFVPLLFTATYLAALIAGR